MNGSKFAASTSGLATTLYAENSGRSHGHLLLSLVVLGLIFALVKCVYTRFLHLRQIPGPSLAAWSRWWLIRAYASQDSAYRLIDVNQRYGRSFPSPREDSLTQLPRAGPLARIGPNHILTDDPDIQIRVLETRSPYLRGPWFDSLRFDPHFASIASERDMKKHDKLRKTVAAGVSKVPL